MRYAFLYQGEVVLRLNPKVDKQFVGDFRDRHLAWSKRTIGLDLVFRAIVDTKLGQANLDYDGQGPSLVTVTSAPCAAPSRRCPRPAPRRRAARR